MNINLHSAEFSWYQPTPGDHIDHVEHVHDGSINVTGRSLPFTAQPTNFQNKSYQHVPISAQGAVEQFIPVASNAASDFAPSATSSTNWVQNPTYETPESENLTERTPVLDESTPLLNKGGYDYVSQEPNLGSDLLAQSDLPANSSFDSSASLDKDLSDLSFNPELASGLDTFRQNGAQLESLNFTEGDLESGTQFDSNVADLVDLDYKPDNFVEETFTFEAPEKLDTESLQSNEVIESNDIAQTFESKDVAETYESKDIAETQQTEVRPSASWDDELSQETKSALTSTTNEEVKAVDSDEIEEQFIHEDLILENDNWNMFYARRTPGWIIELEEQERMERMSRGYDPILLGKWHNIQKEWMWTKFGLGFWSAPTIEGAKEAISENIVNPISSTAHNAKEAIADATSGLKSGLTHAFSSISTGATGLVDNIRNNLGVPSKGSIAYVDAAEEKERTRRESELHDPMMEARKRSVENELIHTVTKAC